MTWIFFPTLFFDSKIIFNVWFMSFGQSVEFRNWCWMSNILIVIFFNCGQVLLFVAHSRHHKGALTQKRSFLVICTTIRSAFCVGLKIQNKHSTLNLSFNALSKWHEPDINDGIFTLIPGRTSKMGNRTGVRGENQVHICVELAFWLCFLLKHAPWITESTKWHEFFI